MNQEQILFCNVSVAPVRAENSDSSEMVTQLVFGEGAIELEKNGNWIKLKALQDDYIGWVDFKQVWCIDLVVWEKWLLSSFVQFEANYIFSLNGKSVRLCSGSRVGRKGELFEINNNQLKFTQEIGDFNSLLQVADELMFTPYLWGGRTSFGIDCSGLTQLCFLSENIQLPRDASQQVNHGNTIQFEDRKPKDVCFFINQKGKVNHVGILNNQLEIIHAHGWVRIDDLTEKGIVRRTDNELSHQLFCIKRFDLTC